MYGRKRNAQWQFAELGREGNGQSGHRTRDPVEEVAKRLGISV